MRAPSVEVLVGKPLREKIMLIVYYRYCGSHVETLKALAAAVSPDHWVKVLNALPNGAPIIRTDAYHANWGTGVGRGRAFFLEGICHKLAHFTADAVLKWQKQSHTRTMIECVDHMQNFFQKSAAKQFQGQSFKFNAITATFDLAELVKDAIDPYGECYMGLNAYTGMNKRRSHDVTQYTRRKNEAAHRRNARRDQEPFS